MWTRRHRDSLTTALAALDERVRKLEDEVARATLRWGELADITRRAQARWETRERRDASQAPLTKLDIRRLRRPHVP